MRRRRLKSDDSFGRGGEITTEREAVERRWFRRCNPAPELARLVTGAALADEPFHRWLSYKQAFAPALVRRFLEKGSPVEPAADAAPLLDPFCGSGTFAIECARRGVNALGIEALPVLAYLARARSTAEFGELPDLQSCQTWEDYAERLSLPLHRAALICAVARRHTSDGKPNRDAHPLATEFESVVTMMREDLRQPLPLPVTVQSGDARDLSGVADDSIGGILTSPPYLSRHDYTRQTRPHEQVYDFWHAGATPTKQRQAQVRAHPRAYRRTWRDAMHPAISEACDALHNRGETKLAGVVRSYFEDMSAALHEFARVLRDERPCWLVVGGARLKDVYIPSDTILADIARESGFTVLALDIARKLIPGGRSFGTLTRVAPRETVIVLRRDTREDP